MSGAGRVDDQTFGIANIGNDGKEFYAIHQFPCFFSTALYPENYHAVGSIGQIFDCQRIKTGIFHPAYFGVFLQKFCHRDAVFAVAGGSQRQRFQALQENPCCIRGKGRALISQTHCPQPQSESYLIQISQIVSKTQTVVAPVGFVIESKLRVAPIKVAAVDHRSANGSAMSAYPFGQRVDDNVCSVFNGTQQCWRRKGGIHHQRQMIFSGDFRISFDIRNSQSRIANRFDINRPGAFIDCTFHGGKVVQRRKVDLDPLLGQYGIELGKRPTVKVIC